ncbi:hypothetical protein F4778DRAFT_763116 [Xylariomycetidae sp. FL2044]|nr:hypothetical protein F4778DRAFT_763116 [Xylariomycetidae sp. FL2044]
MPVTELALLPTTTPNFVSAAYLEAVAAGIDYQNTWCATHAPSLSASGGNGNSNEARGAAIWQPLGEEEKEGEGMGHRVLISAHWDSVEQHERCIASEGNQEVMRRVLEEGLADVEGMRVGHLEEVGGSGGWLFSGGEEEEEKGGREKKKKKKKKKGPFEAPVIRVMRVRVKGGNRGREEFERVWGMKEGEEKEKEKGVQERLEEIMRPYRQRGGWRVEKEEGEEEFVVVGGVESLEVGKGVEQSEVYREEVWGRIKGLASSVETGFYKRIF